MIHNISMKKIILALLSFNFILSSYADIDTCLNAYDTKAYKNILTECTTPANDGDSVSQNILGWWYLYGQEDIDYSKAFIWLSKSSDQGNTWAKGQIGLMYQNGTGVLKDYSKALIFLTDAGEDWKNELDKLETIINEESAKEEIYQAIDKIKNTKTISANRIGKWYTSDSAVESETCNGEDTSEIIILHDQVLQRTYSNDYSFLKSDFETSYYNFLDDYNLLFFPENVIYFSETMPEIWDFYFKTPIFAELKSNSGYISLNLFKCDNLNNQIDYILLESDAIEFDKLIFTAKKECQNKKPIDCLRKFVNFADVSKNNELSRAELTRFSKFVVKWLTLKGELNLTERMGSSAATMVIAPALAEFILLNYDYDNDEHLDIKEMTFDLVNISGSSDLNNKIIRRYIEVLDLASESKINASRMLDDLF
jgi:hypothetical protein